MTKYLLHRPIAVFMVTLALLVFSVLALLQLPISLLPAIDVPSIVIRIESPNSAPGTIEENLLKPIRENLLTLSGLENIESIASGESGLIQLRFSYQAPMDLMYIEVNERIDRLQSQLPQGLTRPKVIRLSTGNIPIVRLQVIPTDENNYVAISELTTKVLRRRIEQLPGVSMVNIVGERKTEIAVTPLYNKLRSLNIPLSVLLKTIDNSNINWGAISVKDGQYRYYVKVATSISTPQEILHLPIQTQDGRNIRIKDVALVEEREQPALGHHLFNKDNGLAIIIHKQNSARMMDLMAHIKQSVKVFEKEYPQVHFTLTQDQSILLNAGITNLKTALFYGGIFAFIVLFIFMSNIRLAIIMGVSLPLSLMLSFIIFYLFNISINIISLSGLALGLGMLIDNAIIVLDNISAKRLEGHSLTTSCVLGVKEVSAPLISTVLTTLAVFVPLVFLHGMSGALFTDQAIAVAAILSVSLLISFSVLPLLYNLFFTHRAIPDTDSLLFKWVLRVYNRFFTKAWKSKGVTLGMIGTICLVGFWLGLRSPKTILPAIERHEILLKIAWNEPIGLAENKQRVLLIVQELANKTSLTEAEIGEIGTLSWLKERGRGKSEIYLKLKDDNHSEQFSNKLSAWLKKKYPDASFSIDPAPNAFDQLFSNPVPYIRIKLRARDSLLSANRVLSIIGNTQEGLRFGSGYALETSFKLIIDNEKLALYEIDRAALQLQLSRVFGRSAITVIKEFGKNTVVSLIAYPNAQHDLNQLFIRSNEGSIYPLSNFVSLSYGQDNKYITADNKGVYQAIYYDQLPDVGVFINKAQEKFVNNGILLDFDGEYFSTRRNLLQLGFVLMISLALLYFILAAQFESFLQPLVIIFTLPLGIGGSLLLIYLTGSSLNIMSAIGIIVMLGIMINDAILKLDTINRHINQSQNLLTPETIYQAIHKAGILRLRPILMTSITTILALTPILFTSGLGADLQRGLVIAVIGGLTVGTITSLFFVPLAYYYIISKRINR